MAILSFLGILNELVALILLAVLFSSLFSSLDEEGIWHPPVVKDLPIFIILIFTFSYYWDNVINIYNHYIEAAYSGNFDSMPEASFFERLKQWLESFYIYHFFPIKDLFGGMVFRNWNAGFPRILWMFITPVLFFTSIYFNKGIKRNLAVICCLQFCLILGLFANSKASEARFCVRLDSLFCNHLCGRDFVYSL